MKKEVQNVNLQGEPSFKCLLGAHDLREPGMVRLGLIVDRHCFEVPSHLLAEGVLADTYDEAVAHGYFGYAQCRLCDDSRSMLCQQMGTQEGWVYSYTHHGVGLHTCVCGAVLTDTNAVLVAITMGHFEFTARSCLIAGGVLRDVDDVIRKGFCEYASCARCGMKLSELASEERNEV